MKCIKAIKPTKQIKVGTIKRVQDKDADLAVKDGYWQYVAKSEWKSKEKEIKQDLQEAVENTEAKKTKK